MRRMFAAAVAATLLVAAPAGAAPTWVPTGTLAPDGATAPIAGLGPNGDAVVAWSRAGALEARVRAPGAAFGDVQPIAAGASAHDVAVAEDGTAFLAWSQADGVWFAIRPPGGAFTATALDAGGPAAELDVAVNARGDALIAFRRAGAWASLRPAGGSFEAPVALAGGDGCDVQAAVGAAGDAAVAWHDNCAASGTSRVARRPAGGGWGAAETQPVTGAVDVAVTAGGLTALLLEGSPVRIAAPGGAFTPSGPAAGASGTLSADGPDVLAAWIAGGRVQAARSVAGGPVTSLGELSGSGASGPVARAGADGRLTVAWSRATGDGSVLEAVHAPAGGTFVAATPATGPAAALTADADGNALAVTGAAGLPGQVLDAAGPRLTLDARKAGFAEETYPFAVTAADAWSTVASTAFDFGDGTTAPGPAAEHAFATPGPRTVTVTGTDALGNVSTLASPFDVAPALDRTAPVLTKVRMDARKFRISSKPTPTVAAVRRGTRFRYTVSEPAYATILFERVTGGRRKGKRCVARRRTGKKCRIYRPAGLITRRHSVAGPVSVGFTGRIVAGDGPISVAEARLRPGRYRATIIAADDARNASKPKRLSFRVLR